MTFSVFGRKVQVTPRGVAVFSTVGELTIYDVIAKNRQLLLRRDNGAVRRLIGAYKVAEVEIEKRLNAVIAKLDAATLEGTLDVSPSWFFQLEEWSTLLVEVRGQVDQLSKVAYSESIEAQERSIAMGTKHAAELVKASGVRGGFIMLPKEAFTDLVGALSDGSPLKALFANMGEDAVSLARHIFAAGFAAGDNPRKIGRALKVALPKQTRDRMVLIARTESLRAYRTAQSRNFKENSDVVVAMRIVSARDARTCFLCIARDGEILEPGEIFGSHPGCRCTLSPVVKYLDRPRINGEEWLRDQPEEVQREKLGPSRFKMWNDHEATLADFTQKTQSSKWGQGVRPRTLNELRQDKHDGNLGREFDTTPPPISKPIAGKGAGSE